jgi:hypothetical protein
MICSSVKRDPFISASCSGGLYSKSEEFQGLRSQIFDGRMQTYRLQALVAWGSLAVCYEFTGFGELDVASRIGR